MCCKSFTASSSLLRHRRTHKHSQVANQGTSPQDGSTPADADAELEQSSVPAPAANLSRNPSEASSASVSASASAPTTRSQPAPQSDDEGARAELLSQTAFQCTMAPDVRLEEFKPTVSASASAKESSQAMAASALECAPRHVRRRAPRALLTRSQLAAKAGPSAAAHSFARGKPRVMHSMHRAQTQANFHQAAPTAAQFDRTLSSGPTAVAPAPPPPLADTSGALVAAQSRAGDTKPIDAYHMVPLVQTTNGTFVLVTPSGRVFAQLVNARQVETAAGSSYLLLPANPNETILSLNMNDFGLSPTQAPTVAPAPAPAAASAVARDSFSCRLSPPPLLLSERSLLPSTCRRARCCSRHSMPARASVRCSRRTCCR